MPLVSIVCNLHVASVEPVLILFAFYVYQAKVSERGKLLLICKSIFV